MSKVHYIHVGKSNSKTNYVLQLIYYNKITDCINVPQITLYPRLSNLLL